MLYRRRSDQRVRKANIALPTNSAGSFGDRTIDRDFPERRQQLGHQMGAGSTGEQLGSRYHRVVQPVTVCAQATSPPEVIDEHVGIDEDLSHGSSRPGSASSLADRPHTCLQAQRRHRRAGSPSTRRGRAESPVPASTLLPWSIHPTVVVARRSDTPASSSRTYSTAYTMKHAPRYPGAHRGSAGCRSCKKAAASPAAAAMFSSMVTPDRLRGM